MSNQISLNGRDWLFKGFMGEDWSWRKSHQPATRDQRGWLPATVPGSVSRDLWENEQIPDPYFECNSLLIEWVPARTWVYKKTFTVGEENRGQRVQLRFTGVDYDAQFFLNGHRLGEHHSMYTPALFDVSDQLNYGEENLLAVVIEPAPPEQPQVGRTSRVTTHKSRMTYWWDFSPRMVHQGIWDDVGLEISGPARIENVWVRPSLAEDYRRAEAPVTVSLSAGGAPEVEVQVKLRLDGRVVASAAKVVGGSQSSQVEFHLAIDDPELWWPNGFGAQPLYEAEVRLLVGGVLSDDRRDRFGIREVSFTANETRDETARPHTLQVNGRTIYIKGWNWVPMDVMYGVEQPEKRERLLSLAQRAHVNLLRVWGGGLIEKDAFYELCDRMGILVWQEFIQSSSGIDNVPSDSEAFIELMVREAEQIIPLKRNHPSLAIWCGGNELKMGEEPLDDDHPLLSALKTIVNRLDPDRAWLPTSPSGPVFSNSLEEIAARPEKLHDVHGPWEHQGVTKHQTLYNQGACLLHSEFGVEGITNRKTLDAVVSKERQWPVDLDNPVWRHLGAWWVKQPLWQETFGALENVGKTVQALQFLQADGLRYAIEANRRRKYQNSGSLPWQFNEPYPMAACTSAVDYFAEPKPAYYAVAQAYQPLVVTARFPTQAWKGRSLLEFEPWAANSDAQGVERATLLVSIIGASGECYTSWQKVVSMKGNAAARLAALDWKLGLMDEEVFFLDVKLLGDQGFLAGNRYVFSMGENLAPLLKVMQTGLEINKSEGDEVWQVALANRGSSAAMFVWLEDARPVSLNGAHRGYVFFNENYFCLLPGEQKVVQVEWSGVPVNERKVNVQGWNTPRYECR